MRTKRSIEGVGDTEYVYEGGQLLQMQYLYYIFDFSYGADGRAVGFSVTNTDDMSKSFFYYALNSRGDVIALYNSAGTKICTYSYDAYGKLLSTSLFSNTSSDRIASNFNPLRYRSYVYDRETGLYYLQTRYYDPVTCRFVNGDCQLNIDTFTGYNQFAYCDNMPTNCSDPTGTSFVRESAGGYYCGFPGISYGGTGISSGGGGARVGYNVPVTYNYITRPSSGLIALAPVGIVVGLGTADLLAEMFYLKKANRTATAETELTTANKGRTDSSPIYYGAQYRNNSWDKVAGPMNAAEAYRWVNSTANSPRYGKDASWGLYTSKRSDAFKMATVLGNGIPIYDSPLLKQYPHYHVSGRDFGK